MSRKVFVACLLGAVIAMPAFAQTPHRTNPMKMKCEDFIAVDEAYRPAVVYYLAGVDKMGIAETDTMTVDTATPIAALVAECQKTPKASLRTKVRTMYKSGQLALFDHH
ncbi:HdeA/HdeB family chaperone [Paraburkholderia rhizosphaerae]|uniref:Acid stress chaperone HdeA n=2 Tax=Paraburkholderia rhizosphaerae TaxID=480658 RepID=A0A4R8L9K7_9BURK|nr:HdeA/HdeB family chaperone [Paraburkholderia rhizosphaerae]TDY38848.1 acid stress chaperone HdeA [Paraburkholderia rhizosphaerae]